MVWQGELISSPNKENQKSEKREFYLTHMDGVWQGPQAEHPGI